MAGILQCDRFIARCVPLSEAIFLPHPEDLPVGLVSQNRTSRSL